MKLHYADELKPYPEIAESGLPWIGQVPAHWAVLPLCAVATPKSIVGQQHRELLSVYLDRGVIRFSDVEEKRTNVTSEDLTKYQAVDPGDFVLNNQQAWRGSVGVSNISGIVSPAYLVFSLTPRLNTGFANLLFREQAMVSQYRICSRGVGSIQRNLYWPQLKRVVFPAPPLAEQHAIVRFLDHADRRIQRYIRAKQKLIALLEERWHTIIHHAVIGRIDVRTRRPYPSYKQSGVDWVGAVPEHWEVRILGHLGQLFKGAGGTKADESEQGVPCVRYGDLYTTHEFFITKSRKYVTKERAVDYTPIRYGDVLFAGSGETIDEIGKSAANLLSGQACCGGDVIVFRPRKSCNARFLGYATDSWSSSNQKSTMGRGITVMHIYGTNLKYVSVVLPSLKEQNTIVEFLDGAAEKVRRAKTLTQRKIELLQEYRTRLIADVVTGKLDVREAAAGLPEDDVFGDAEESAVEFT